jgi:hypothetical protein
MSQAMTIERDVHFRRYGRGNPRYLEARAKPQPQERRPGRIPRIARLMALAIRFEEQVRQGLLGSYAELAALGHVSRARVSQIMNLVNLAPDLQEALLFLPDGTGPRPHPPGAVAAHRLDARLAQAAAVVEGAGAGMVPGRALRRHDRSVSIGYLASPYSHPDPAVRE